MSMQDAALAKLTQAEILLAEASSVDEVTHIQNLAEAARVYYKQLDLSTRLINNATKIKLKAERKLADVVDEGQERGEIASKSRGGANIGTRSPSTVKPMTLKDLNVSSARLSEARKIRDTFTEEEIEAVVATADEKGKEVSRHELLKIARRQQRQKIEHTAANPDTTIPDSVDGRTSLLHGDFRERLTALEPGSVDLILTDPPYPKEDLPLWSDLAKHSARLLGPRGLLISYTGQLFLPEVIERVSEHLTYGWTFALMLPGSGSRIMGRHMIQGWKPVVAFSTGAWPSGEWADDVLISPERQKVEYEWQQNIDPARRLIERFTAPDGLVVDPFLGVGSFGVAAVQAGRKFVGVELDRGRFEKARETIAVVQTDIGDR